MLGNARRESDRFVADVVKAIETHEVTYYTGARSAAESRPSGEVPGGGVKSSLLVSAETKSGAVLRATRYLQGLGEVLSNQRATRDRQSRQLLAPTNTPSWAVVAFLSSRHWTVGANARLVEDVAGHQG